MAWWSRTEPTDESQTGGRGEGTELEQWVDGMQPRLAGFQDLVLPEDFPFEYSRASLAALEEWLLAMFPGAAALERAALQVVEGSAAYIGETVRRAAGGSWTFNEEPGSVFFHRFLLVPDDGSGIPLSPVDLISTAVARRTGSVLPRLYEAVTSDAAQQRVDLPRPTLLADARAEGPRGSSGELTAWLSSMDDELSRWLSNRLWARGVAPFSIESLDAVDEEVLTTYADLDSIAADPAYWTGAVRYFGETVRRACDGEWAYNPGDPNENMFNGRPLVRRTFVDDDPQSLVPVLVLRQVVRKRRRGTLVDVARRFVD